MGRTAVEGRARLARELRRFPRLRAAYEAGELGLEAAVLVVRILGRETVSDEGERAWVNHATGVTVSVHQRYPTFVIECEGASIALGEEVAAAIRVWQAQLGPEAHEEDEAPAPPVGKNWIARLLGGPGPR